MPETRSGASTSGASGNYTSTGGATTSDSNANAGEIEQLRQQIAQLTNLVRSSANMYYVPDPIKQLSEFTGNKKEITIWIDEVDQLYKTFKMKGENGAPDTMNAYYIQAIKNKIKGEARITLCANGNPSTIPEIKRVLLQHYGDHRDLATNLSHLFSIKRGDKSNLRFYSEMKELSSKIKINLTMNPLECKDMVEMLITTKYLDNIDEPLASIIRQSKPESLEEAYQAVCINQNAESRTRSTKKPLYRSNDSKFKNRYSNNSDNKYDPKPDPKHSFKKKTTSQKPAFKAKAEIHNRVLEEEREEEEPDTCYDDDSDDYELDDATEQADELNFQIAVRKKQIT